MNKNFRLEIGKFLILFLSLTVIVSGAYLKNYPVNLNQPNGSVIKCFITGDEYHRIVHDENGYTIIKDKDSGYFVYAYEENGDLISSEFIVGEINPFKTDLQVGANISLAKLEKKLEIYKRTGSPLNTKLINKAPTTGTLNNIVIFIRFSDQSEFTDTVSSYDSMFNSSTLGDNSMRNYFQEVSYNQLTISTTMYPTTAGSTVVSYQDTHVRGYYLPQSTDPVNGYADSDQAADREWALLKNAVDTVSSQISGTLNVDGDNDGKVDNVCFIVAGDVSSWGELLWPHMWSMGTGYDAYINGKVVSTFNFQLRDALTTSGVGVLCHEMFHSLGAPDLYHYTSDGISPAGDWDIMEADKNPPQHMGMFMKQRYGKWLASIPEITTTGSYSLNPVTSSTNNCYKIASPNSTTEYFVVEYRQKQGTFENSLPASGLLVYRINTAQDGLGNAQGPPDEVYIYRPNGTSSVNGDVITANFSSDVSRTSINDSTNPSSFLTSGGAGGLDISSIGASGSTISFYVTISGSVQPTPTPNISSGAYTLYINDGTGPQPTNTPASVQGENCSNPFEVTPCVTLNGDTTSMSNDYDPTSAGCASSYAQPGFDQVWHFTGNGNSTTITLDPNFDGALYVVTDCSNVLGTCVGGSDVLGQEVVTFTSTNSQDYYIIVDSYDVSVLGTYTLFVDNGCSGPPPTNTPISATGEDCSSPFPISIGQTLAGDTTSATQDYTSGCSYSYYSAEQVWKFTGDGSTVNITMTPASIDCLIIVLSGDCNTCIGYADLGYGGDAETYNLATSNGVEYAVVCAGYDSPGSYNLSITTTK